MGTTLKIGNAWERHTKTGKRFFSGEFFGFPGGQLFINEVESDNKNAPIFEVSVTFGAPVNGGFGPPPSQPSGGDSRGGTGATPPGDKPSRYNGNR
jgi:hypothetical protein